MYAFIEAAIARSRTTMLIMLMVVIAGLFLGKQLGVTGAVWLAVRSGVARLPEGVSWSQIYGISLIAGIGFTMSLFIGSLAFADPEHAAMVRIGVMFGSLLSAVCGLVVLSLAGARGRRTFSTVFPQEASCAPRQVLP